MKGTEKTTIIVAAIGGICAIVAALIGLFNPVVTRIADRVLTAPTATAAPSATAMVLVIQALNPTATPVPPPTQTKAPKPTATATRLPTYVAPQSNALAFILANNNPETDDFFIDGAFVTTITSGQVLVFDVSPGTHQLESCPTNENPLANPADCESQRYAVSENPFDWELGSQAQATDKVTLVLMNISSTATDIYIDGALAHPLEANRFYLLTVPPGKHTFQNCPHGVTPDQTDTTCVDPVEQPLQAAVEIWKVGE